MNKLLEVFDTELIKEAIKNCPKDDFVIITSSWAYDRPEYTREEQLMDNDVNDLLELETAIGYPVFVDEGNQLVCDPYGILNE